MPDMNMIWLVINLVSAVLLAVSTINAFLFATASAVFTSLLFLFAEILICIIPWTAALLPYFGFLKSGVGAPLLLIIIACFYIYNIQNFCSRWDFCYGQIVGIIVVAAMVVELVFKKDELSAEMQKAGEGVRANTEFAKGEFKSRGKGKQSQGQQDEKQQNEITTGEELVE
ncbi:Transmembrane domain-containing protein [Spironucleus salmonicida]|uniref:Transmembrane domain-containing protein n=1 Tax=Spironucleus salmonicida TaxID=348837 RepID=V6LLQ1_9EUKA|nr:Transmembrane domain-containing protein [Spironucleus salmonicida]|eukprot:EST41639.1 Transmembrane domain-containing protein [Spironucleus salmonicida]